MPAGGRNETRSGNFEGGNSRPTGPIPNLELKDLDLDYSKLGAVRDTNSDLELKACHLEERLNFADKYANQKWADEGHSGGAYLCRSPQRGQIDRTGHMLASIDGA